MKRLRSDLIYQSLLAFSFILIFLGIFLKDGFCILYIDINAPAIRKLKVAVPDFSPMEEEEKRADLKDKLANIVENDLRLSGYFSIIEKSAFLTNKVDLKNLNLKDWSAIGAELLIVGRYRTISRSILIEMRAYDVYWAKQIMAKRILGEIKDIRFLVHKLDNQLLKALTGEPGIFTTKVAFVSNMTGHKEIYIADYDGYNLRQITFYKSISLLPRLSPDGKRLIYTSYIGKRQVLYLRDIETGKDRIISKRRGLNVSGSWSPDGKMIAVTLSIRGNPDIYLMDTNGKILKRITRYWGIDTDPCFSPDGKKIAFVSNRSGSPQIYVYDLSSGSIERITYEGKYNSDPSWSSLNRIAYSCMLDSSFDICTINPDGTDMRRLTQDPANDESPCWSPDGRYIIFSSNRTGRYQLYIMTANGENQIKITSLEGDQTSPSWSP